MYDFESLLSSVAFPAKDATDYVARGWFPVPLCWPNLQGECACGRNHTKAGKLPLFRDYAQARATPSLVADWWTATPRANVGLLLAPSNLLVLDLDSEDALTEARSYGLPETLTVNTGAGKHFYYQRPEDFPTTRLTKKGNTKKIDVLSLGYTVAPPSLHRKGVRYTWEVFDRAVNLPEPPKWVYQMLGERVEQKTRSIKPAWGLDRSIFQRRADGTLNVSFDPNTTDEAILRQALLTLSATEYDTWYKVGMALAQWDAQGNGNGKGLELWDEWSRSDPKGYPGRREIENKWRSYRRRTGNVTNVGKVYALARENGFSVKDARQKAKDFDPTAVKRRGAWFNPESANTK